MKKEIQPSFYAIIPASVRYDKDLKPNAKLLYGEITALCNREGYCWAGNQYFAKLYGVSTRTVSRWVTDLADKGYITIKIERDKQTNKVRRRLIYITDLANKMDLQGGEKKPVDKNVLPTRQKCPDPIDKNVLYNNTSNNTLNNKNICSDKSEPIPFKNIIEYLNKKANRQFNYKARKNRSLIRARVNEGYTEDDFYKVIDVKVKDWLGNPTMEKYLRPSTLFSNKFDQYLNESATTIKATDPGESSMPVFK